MSIRHLDHLFCPRSIAVIGASDRPSHVGTTVWRNLMAGGFNGPVVPINPKHRTLDGQAVFPTVGVLPFVPDLAVVCTPASTVREIVRALGALGTRAVIIMTSGLGAQEKQAILDEARPHLLRVLGPNCLGVLTPRLGLNASFAHKGALEGSIAFVSQSGALVTAVLDWATTRRIGFSHLVSIGEHLDVDFGDVLDYLADDPGTRSILLYIESIESPRKFMSAARAAARNKPVIVVKAGRAGRGVAAATSHTGALAGSDAVYDAAIRRAGMLRVDTLQDLFMAAQTVARFQGHHDAELTIMTNGGGAGVMAADAAGLHNVRLAELGAPLRRQLDTVLPSTWSGANPVDIIGDAPVERYAETMRALLATPATGTVLFIHAPTAIVRSDDIARACIPVAQAAAGRLMSCWLGDDAVFAARRLFQDAGIPDYATPEEAVKALAMLSTYGRNQALLLEAPAISDCPPSRLEDARRLVAEVLSTGRTLLDEAEGKALLKAYGIPIVATLAAAATEAAVLSAAGRIGYPVALKIRSPDISHKSDAGGVALGLENQAQVAIAVRDMLAHLRDVLPGARLDGFTVQAMVKRPFAEELILGASVDPVFGPVVLFGHGGTAVEVLADRALALPPLNRTLARDMIARTRVARQLAGYRNRPPARLDAICDALVALSRLIAEIPEVAELDINPLWADAEGVIALDARVRLDARGGGGAARFAIAPYPDELVEILEWQESTLCLRPIRPEDETQLRRFAARLAAADRPCRGFGRGPVVPTSDMARMTQIDYDREMALVAEWSPSGRDRSEVLGFARVRIDPDNFEGELGLVALPDWAARGLGTLMLDKLVRILQGRGTRRLIAKAHVDDVAMRELASIRGFVEDPTGRQGDSMLLVKAL